MKHAGDSDQNEQAGDSIWPTVVEHMLKLQAALLLALLATTSVGYAASDQENRERLFNEFCLKPGSKQKTVDALQASPKVGPATVREYGGTRYISFQVKGIERAVVTVINPSAAGLWCSVGIKNVGINLYTDGRVIRE